MNSANADQQKTLQGPFKEGAAEWVDVPVAPFGDQGLHVVFYKHEPQVELNGSFTLEQMRVLLNEMEHRYTLIRES